MPPAVLLLEDGHSPFALAAVRAFGKAGWRVGLGGPQAHSRVARSRWVRRRHHVPLPEHGLPAFVDAVNVAAQAEGYGLVFAADDAELLALSATRNLLQVQVPYASHDVVLRAVDKLTLSVAASDAGIATPLIVAAGEATGEVLRMPVVVKPRLHWTPGGKGTTRHLPVARCTTPQQVRAVAARITDGGGEALYQQAVEGTLMAVTVVTDQNARPLAAMHQRTTQLSLRDKSARAQTIAVEPRLQHAVERLLDALGWQGLANLQFLQPAGGPAQLIDFNGRFYGSQALSLAAGLNLPVVWARAAVGLPALPARDAQVGVRFQALEEDLRRARCQRRGGLLADLVTTLSCAPRSVHVTWSATDPAPAAATAARIAQQVLRKQLRDQQGLWGASR